MPAPLPRLSDVTREQVNEQQSLDFMKYLSTLAETRGNEHGAADMYLQRFPESFSASTMRKMLEAGGYATKAAIAPGTSTDAAWAKPLVGIQQITSGFLAVAHAQRLLGRLGLELIPANTKVPYQTAEANFVWMPESFVAPTSKLAFSDGITLPPTKVVGIVVHHRGAREALDAGHREGDAQLSRWRLECVCRQTTAGPDHRRGRRQESRANHEWRDAAHGHGRCQSVGGGAHQRVLHGVPWQRRRRC